MAALSVMFIRSGSCSAFLGEGISLRSSVLSTLADQK